MSGATLNLRVLPRRMLNAREAAEYVGIPSKRFRQDCSVSPVEIPGGHLAWDLHDLDDWLDALKGGCNDDDDAIVDRLG